MEKTLRRAGIFFFATAVLTGPGAGVVASPTQTPVPARGQPDTVLTYRMTFRIRPLLPVWVGVGDVGGARITYRHGDGGARGFELLVASDPQRAPRGMNRWGYIREDAQPEGADITGVMKQGAEPSPDGRQRPDVDATRTGYPIKVIRTTIRGGSCQAVTKVRWFPSDMTSHDLPALIESVEQAPDTVRTGTLTLGPETNTGMMTALDRLLRDVVDGYRSSGRGSLAVLRKTTYVFNGRLYDLRVGPSRQRRDVSAGGRRYPMLVESVIETTKRASHETEEFRLAFAVDGPLAGKPIVIAYQPRWWLKAELVLDDRAAW